MTATTLEPDMLRRMDAWWRAANYLSVGQMYLLDNPLLRRQLFPADIKPILLGHWGTTPGQNFIYVHLNRVIRKYDLDMIYVSGPGHGGPALVANTYLEGSYSEIYPEVSQDEPGLQKLFRQFSFPGGIPSHVSPECPGSIHEGGELGYSLSHSFGAAFDNPALIVACVIGDGEAETGPLATAWHSNKFLNPASDGAVLPILHLNGYKIANPTLLARIPREELEQLLRGYGWTPHFVSGHEPGLMHETMATTLDLVIEQIQFIQQQARVHGKAERPRWPMIVLESPKGWTGPKFVDGQQVEGTFHAHQVPIRNPANQADHLQQLDDWLRSYRPQELFDDRGCLLPELAALAPAGIRRMGVNPHANGGLLLRDLELPDFRRYAQEVPQPGTPGPGDTRVLGPFLRDVIRLNETQRNFRIFGPDETVSNGLGAVFETTQRQWNATTIPGDELLAPDGRVLDSMLSEHQCEGWLEGYLLTGRHGLFNCYEAFIHIIDSMFNQHAKWLKVTRQLPWRRPIASLNYLLASHVWRQDHNGFTHQDPGFIDHVVNKKAEIVRVYLPPDGNCLLSVMDHCLRSRHYVNVVIAGKHPAPQWLSMDAADRHCTAGIGRWDWAGNDHGATPDVVMACCGDVPTLETLAAVSILRQHLPELRIRVVNVVDLMKLQPPEEHPHGLNDTEFDALFTTDRPVIFAFHSYPTLIHRLTYRRANHENFHVRGYREEGTITTPFDMTVLNGLDRFHLAMEVVRRLPKTAAAGQLKQHLEGKLIEHRQYINQNGQDLPEIPQLAVDLMEFKDYYARLGVEKKATQDQIKGAYRKLARKYHPDVSKEADAEAQFKEVAEAYEVLRDPERRAAYDTVGTQHGGQQDFRPPPGWNSGFEFSGAGGDGADLDHSDFFEALFGRAAAGMRGAQGPVHTGGNDHHAKVQIDLMDSYRGVRRTISLQVPVRDTQGNLSLESRQLEVNIPKGVRDGQHLRLKGMGGPGHGAGPAGDLYLEIHFAPHKLFRVDGRDIYLDLPVAPWEAALGASVTVPAPDGNIQLSIPAGSPTGRKLRLKGKGLPGAPAGDLYAVISIALPKADDDASKAAYQALAQSFDGFNPRTGMGE